MKNQESRLEIVEKNIDIVLLSRGVGFFLLIEELSITASDLEWRLASVMKTDVKGMPAPFV